MTTEEGDIISPLIIDKLLKGLTYKIDSFL